MMHKYFLRNVLLYMAIILPPGLLAQLRINPGASLIMNGTANLVLNNTSFINNGNFISGNSTITVTGNAINNNAFFSSTNSTSFNNLVINKQSNDFLLSSDLAVTGTLAMQKGNLLLNSNTLNLGTTGTIAGENDRSHITGGTLMATRSFKSSVPRGVNPGNMGLEFTTDVNPGTVVVSRTNEPQTMPNGKKSIARSFTVTATTNSNLNATLLMYYLDAELGTNMESGLTMWNGSDFANTWLPAGKDSSNTAANWVLKTGIDHFTRYTLFDSSGLIEIGEPPITDTLIYTPPGTSEFARRALQTQIYPNPVQDQFTMVFFSDQPQNGIICLYDQLGNLLEYRKLPFHAGINQLTWDMHSYAPGIYFLAGNYGKKKIKIIKQ